MDMSLLRAEESVSRIAFREPIQTGESPYGFAQTLISTRQNVSPKRLVEPGPSEVQLEQLFRAAAAAPDHGLLRPWRFVMVPTARRTDLAEVFALALVDRDPGATLEQIESAREGVGVACLQQ